MARLKGSRVTRSSNAKINRISIPMSDTEKLCLELATKIMAQEYGEPDLATATLAREILLGQVMEIAGTREGDSPEIIAERSHLWELLKTTFVYPRSRKSPDETFNPPA